MWCGSGGVTVTLSGTWIDGLGGETVLVEWSLDGGAVQSDSWLITTNTNGSKNLSPLDARAIITAWRNGSQLDLTIPGAEPITQQFDLAAIFRQSFVPDFDECLAVPLPTLTLPVTNVDRTEAGPLAYRAARAGGSAWPFSYVWLEAPSDDAPEWAGYSSALLVSCGIDGLGAQFFGLGLDREVSIDGDTVSVSYIVDGGAVNIETWDVWPWAGSRYAISPQDDAAFYAAIKDADSLTITVGSDPEFVETYDLAANGFWDDPRPTQPGRLRRILISAAARYANPFARRAALFYSSQTRPRSTVSPSSTSSPDNESGRSSISGSTSPSRYTQT